MSFYGYNIFASIFFLPFSFFSTSRLGNPSENKLGKVRKQLLEKINSDIIEKLEVNQWRNTDVVLKWFHNITDKSNCSFIQFGIKDIYQAITEKILHQTLKFLKQHASMDVTKLMSQWLVLMEQKLVN